MPQKPPEKDFQTSSTPHQNPREVASAKAGGSQVSMDLSRRSCTWLTSDRTLLFDKQKQVKQQVFDGS